MSWVTLSLRKKELKRSHADYVARELQISREERQMSRQYQYEQTVVQNDENAELRELRKQYREQKSSLYDEISKKRKALSDSSIDDSYKTQLNGEIADLQRQLDEASEDYQEDMNNQKTYWEDELAMIEEEANDVETRYEQEKTDVETQMEVISQELSALDQALSSEIQSCTIKLS